jgi:predicted Zn-dependent protease
MRRTGRIVWLLLVLAGCVAAPAPAPRPQPAVAPPAAPALPAPAAVAQFRSVVAAVEPVAQDVCRAQAPQRNCEFMILVDTRPGQPINAFQTVDRSGRPILIFTLSLLQDARSTDELAFVMGHEAGHHIAGHLDRQRETAVATAIIAGVLAQAGGGGPQAVEAARQAGALVGARVFSQEFELEADAIGTVIAHRAGFDAERGAALFTRLPDPGNRFLATHPPNAARIHMVRATLAQIGAR